MTAPVEPTVTVPRELLLRAMGDMRNMKLINELLAFTPKFAAAPPAPSPDAAEIVHRFTRYPQRGCWKDEAGALRHADDCLAFAEAITSHAARQSAEAVAAERERCAKAALTADSPYGKQTTVEQDLVMADMAQHIATAIRAGDAKGGAG